MKPSREDRSFKNVTARMFNFSTLITSLPRFNLSSERCFTVCWNTTLVRRSCWSNPLFLCPLASLCADIFKRTYMSIATGDQPLYPHYMPASLCTDVLREAEEEETNSYIFPMIIQIQQQQRQLSRECSSSDFLPSVSVTSGTRGLIIKHISASYFL